MRASTTLGLSAVSIGAALLLLAFLSACATLPDAIYHAYPGPDLPDASVAKLELGRASWARIDEVHVDRKKFGAVKLLPGAYTVEWSQRFDVSFLVDPRMVVEPRVRATTFLGAGRTYRLEADRTYGPGYRVYFWIEDAATGEVVYGARKP